jgi:hypothetical protein
MSLEPTLTHWDRIERRRRRLSHWVAITLVVISLAILGGGFAARSDNSPKAPPTCNGQVMSAGDTCETKGGPSSGTSFTYDGNPGKVKDDASLIIIIGGVLVLGSLVHLRTSFSHRVKL